MDIQTSDKEGVKIVKIIGNLDTNTSLQARDIFYNVISDGATRVLLDCTGCISGRSYVGNT